MTVYVLSTMTSPVRYCFYDNSKLDNPILKKSIVIAGGASIPSARSGFGERMEQEDGTPIWVADGFVTPVKDEDYELLKDHYVFKSHLEKNLVKVLNQDITQNHGLIRKHAAGMEEDGFRQLNSKTIKQKIKVSTELLETEQQYRL